MYDTNSLFWPNKLIPGCLNISSLLCQQKHMNETDYVLAYVDYLSHLNGK